MIRFLAISLLALGLRTVAGDANATGNSSTRVIGNTSSAHHHPHDAHRDAHSHGGSHEHREVSSTTSTTTEAPEAPLPAEVVAAQQFTSDVVTAFLESFFHHEVVTKETKKCFQNTTEGFTLALYMVSQKTNEIMEYSDDAEGANAEKMEADVTELMMAAGEAVQQMKNLVKSCISDKMQSAFDQVQLHLNDGGYLLSHMESNADCVYINTIDAAKAVQAEQPEKVAKDIGAALRCFLLSNDELPEGPPEPMDTSAVIEGFFDGFFGKNSTLTIKKVDDLDPKHHIELNISECLEGNMKTWEEAWNQIWVLVSTAASQPQLGAAAPATEGVPVQGGYDYGESETEDPMKQMEEMWNKLTTMILVEFPAAMKTCGISDEQSVMLLDSLGEIDTFQASWQIPGKQDVYVTLETLGKAVDEWQDGHYKRFGESIGVFFRGLLVTFLSDKYYISEADGSLHLIQPAQSGMPLWPVGLGCIAVALLAAMSLRRAAFKSGTTFSAGDVERLGEQDGLLEAVE